MTFVRALPQLANIFVLIALFTFMVALLGMQLFGGIYTPSNGFSSELCPTGICESGLEEKPHFHFDYCPPAMITIFILLTGEWVEIMEPTVDVLGNGVSIFFISVVLFGKLLLMNLLVAVILFEFAGDGENEGSGSSAQGSPSKSGRVSPSLAASAESSPMKAEHGSEEDRVNARFNWRTVKLLAAKQRSRAGKGGKVGKETRLERAPTCARAGPWTASSTGHLVRTTSS